MSPIFIFINGCLFVSAVLFFLKRYRAWQSQKKRGSAPKPTRRVRNETPWRKNAGRADLVLYYPPAHFDGSGYRLDRALNRESILLSITRNSALAIKKPQGEELYLD